MARNRDVVAHLASVEEPRADELVAEESRLVLVDERPCWCSIATTSDEGREGSDDAEDESEAMHLVVECGGQSSGSSTSFTSFQDSCVLVVVERKRDFALICTRKFAWDRKVIDIARSV